MQLQIEMAKFIPSNKTALQTVKQHNSATGLNKRNQGCKILKFHHAEMKNVKR